MKIRIDMEKLMHHYYDDHMCDLGAPKTKADEQSRVILITNEETYGDMWDAERRPVFSVRGKPVSKDIAREIIMRTDNYLYYLREEYDNPISQIFKKHNTKMPRNKKYCAGNMFENNWFPSPEMLAYGWCHPDGYIGNENYSSIKNPFPIEILEIWYFLINNVTQELDLVAVVLDADERVDPERTFDEQIAFGIKVKGNEIEVLNKNETVELYHEYDEKYGDHKLVRPLRDPVTFGLREFLPKVYSVNHKEGGWTGPTGVKHFLDFSDDPTGFAPSTNGLVDKNNPKYYGVPDYTYRDGPMTLEDLEDFAIRWKAEETDEVDEDW